MVFTIEGRLFLEPIPSFQWYLSAKQPLGHRRFGILNSRKAAIISLRTPLVLGIFEVSPA
jgi:hypothetical protein